MTVGPSRTSVIRLQIRPAVYRQKAGFSLTGNVGGSFPIRIFVRKKGTAEAIKQVYKSMGVSKAALQEVGRLILEERH